MSRERNSSYFRILVILGIFSIGLSFLMLDGLGNVSGDTLFVTIGRMLFFEILGLFLLLFGFLSKYSTH